MGRSEPGTKPQTKVVMSKTLDNVTDLSNIDLLATDFKSCFSYKAELVETENASGTGRIVNTKSIQNPHTNFQAPEVQILNIDGDLTTISITDVETDGSCAISHYELRCKQGGIDFLNRAININDGNEIINLREATKTEEENTSSSEENGVDLEYPGIDIRQSIEDLYLCQARIVFTPQGEGSMQFDSPESEAFNITTESIILQNSQEENGVNEIQNLYDSPVFDSQDGAVSGSGQEASDLVKREEGVSSSSTSLLVVVMLILVIAVIVVGGVYFYKKKMQPPTHDTVALTRIQNLSVRASRPQNPEVDIGTGAVTLSDIMEEEGEVKISIIGENTGNSESEAKKTQERASTLSTYVE